MGMSMLKEKGVLAIITIGLAIRIALALTLPWSVPTDESSHLNHIIYMATNWRLPTVSSVCLPAAISIYTSTFSLDANDVTALQNLCKYEFAQPPVYYVVAAVVYVGASSLGPVFAFYSLRILSVLFSVVAIVISYKTIHLLTQNRTVLVSSALMMAFTPKLLETSAGINNDQLSWLFSATAIYCIVLGNRKTGFLSAFAVLTKLTCIPVAIGGMFSLLLRKEMKQALAYLSVFSVMTLWLFTWNAIVWDSPTVLHPPTPVLLSSLREYLMPNFGALTGLQATPTNIANLFQAQIKPNVVSSNMVSLFSFWFNSHTISAWPHHLGAWTLFWGTVVMTLTLIVLLGIYASYRSIPRGVFYTFLAIMALFIVEMNLAAFEVSLRANGRLFYPLLPIVAFFFGSGVTKILGREKSGTSQTGKGRDRGMSEDVVMKQRH